MKPLQALDWLRDRWRRRRGSRPDWPNPVTHMFVEDVHAFIIPHRLRRTAGIQARCEGNPDDVAVALRSLRSLASRSPSRDETTEIVCEAVRTVVQHMLWRGYAAFEIREMTSDDSEAYGRIRRDDWGGRSYRPLEALHYGSLFRLPGLAIGVVAAERRRWDRERPRIRIHGAKRTWFVDMPRSLGGRLGFWWAMKRLNRFTGVFPTWTTTALVAEQNQLRFDVGRYSKWRAAYQALAVKRWSWNGRDTSLTHQTEFFSFYRTLGFHHALAIFREHVMAEINELLNRRLGLNVRISLVGLKTANEILAIRARMEQGELSLGDAFEQATGL
jgi:hypothetical protein